MQRLFWRQKHPPCHLLFRTGPFSLRCHLSCNSTHCFSALSSTSLPPSSSLPRKKSCSGCRSGMSKTDASVCGVLTALKAVLELVLCRCGCSAAVALQILGTCRVDTLLGTKMDRGVLQEWITSSSEHYNSSYVRSFLRIIAGRRQNWQTSGPQQSSFLLCAVQGPKRHCTMQKLVKFGAAFLTSRDHSSRQAPGAASIQSGKAKKATYDVKMRSMVDL